MEGTSSHSRNGGEGGDGGGEVQTSAEGSPADVGGGLRSSAAPPALRGLVANPTRSERFFIEYYAPLLSWRPTGFFSNMKPVALAFALFTFGSGVFLSSQAVQLTFPPGCVPRVKPASVPLEVTCVSRVATSHFQGW